MNKITKKNVANKYRQGSGWVVSNYNPRVGMWSSSNEISYEKACRFVREYKAAWDTTTQTYAETVLDMCYMQNKQAKK